MVVPSTQTYLRKDMPAFALAPIAMAPQQTQQMITQIKNSGNTSQVIRLVSHLNDRSYHAKRTPLMKTKEKTENGTMKIKLCQLLSWMLSLVDSMLSHVFDAVREASCASAIFACEKFPRRFRKVVTFSIMASKSVPVSAVKSPPGQKSFFSSEIVAFRKLMPSLTVLSMASMKLLTSSIIWLAVRELEYNV